MAKEKTQRERVADILLEKGQISNYTTIDTRLSIRLAAIINVLRNNGWKIETKMEGKECIYKLVSAPQTTLFS
jgi:hypothetical protein